MKRLKRNPEKFEVIDLFTAMGREQGYKLAVSGDVDDFIARINRTVKSTQENQRLIHGKRIESMFAHVAGALGRCKLIKQEDSGNTFSTDQNLQAPDYKLILDSGQHFFVEVKNWHFPNFKSLYPLNAEYMEKLENYAKLHGVPLKIAIYFSRFNKWCLLSKESFIEQKNRFVIDFANALAKNEMAILGDRTIATRPDLVVELLADPNKDASINDAGEANFIIGNVKFYCANKEITNDTEKSIAFYLIRFGDWQETTAEAVINGNAFAGVRFVYAPEHPPEEQPFALIGELSSMISSAYNEHTVYERSVIALDTKVDPDVFSVEIPMGYKGESLPLWQFEMQPNPDFEGITSKSNG